MNEFRSAVLAKYILQIIIQAALIKNIFEISTSFLCNFYAMQPVRQNRVIRLFLASLVHLQGLEILEIVQYCSSCTFSYSPPFNFDHRKSMITQSFGILQNFTSLGHFRVFEGSIVRSETKGYCHFRMSRENSRRIKTTLMRLQHTIFVVQRLKQR